MAKISSRQYAQALVGAIDMKKAQDVETELHGLLSVLNEVPELVDYLQASTHSSSDKKKAMQTASKGLSDKVANFMLLIVGNNDLSHLNKIVEIFKKEVMIAAGQMEVVVESVIELNKTLEKALMDVLEKKFDAKISLNKKINADIGGGLRITAGDTVLDSSVVGKLSRLQSGINAL